MISASLTTSDFITLVVLRARAKQVANDAKGNHSFVSFLWYQGTKADGTFETFRFPKGAETEKFAAYVASLGLTHIAGPFKTQKAAKASL